MSAENIMQELNQYEYQFNPQEAQGQSQPQNTTFISEQKAFISINNSTEIHYDIELPTPPLKVERSAKLVEVSLDGQCQDRGLDQGSDFETASSNGAEEEMITVTGNYGQVSNLKVRPLSVVHEQANEPIVVDGSSTSISDRGIGREPEAESSNDPLSLNSNNMLADVHVPATSTSKLISLEKLPDEKLGITVKEKNNKIIIGRVLKGEKADRSGLVHPGDILLSVDGHVLDENTTKEGVIEMVSSCTNKSLDLVIEPISQNTIRKTLKSFDETNNYEKTKYKDPSKTLYLKSKINWDPQKDLGIPCNDANMSFPVFIGDILEILSQDDKNWWQARKVGSIFDKDIGFSAMTGTGLIPSHALLESRVQAAAALMVEREQKLVATASQELLAKSEDETNVEGFSAETKKSSPRNLFNKFSKKSKKSTKIQEKPEKNVAEKSPQKPSVPKIIKVNQSYIELSKITNNLLTTKQKRRPISIIGPRGVGIMDIRSKLIDTNPSLYDLPVPHTSRPPLPEELDGKDYNFLSREEMSQLINENKMIEWGQYNDHYYGTSVDAIRAGAFNFKVSLVAPMNLVQAIPKLSSESIQCYTILVLAALPNSVSTRKSNYTNDEHQFDENTFENQSQYNKICQEGEELFKKYGNIVDKVIVFKNFNQAFRELEQASFALMNFDQYYLREWELK